MNTQNMTSAMRRLIIAREKVARRSEWFGGIIYTARLTEKKIGTMATDGLNIYADPQFVADNDAFIEGVFLHEICHCALDHVSRRKWREKKLWNIACDYAINPMVKRYFPLPKLALLDDRFANMRAEAIYDVLASEQGKGKGDNGEPEQESPAGGDQSELDRERQDGQGGESESKELEQASGEMLEPTPEETEKAREKWRDAVSRTTEKLEREKPGSMPSELKRLISELKPSEKLEWRKILDDWARNSREHVNVSWSRPNRRFLGQDMIMPGAEQTKIHKLVACIDCSGSICDEWVKEMKAELCSLIDQRLVTTVHLIATDTRIVNEAEVTSSDEVNAFKVGQGGGTQFDDAMERVAEINDAMGCVFLTDMATGSFGRDPHMPVVWVDWTKDGTQRVPFGKVCAL